MILGKIKKNDYVEKIKIPVGDLQIGMYVCELDRPWLETPFPLQGLEIKSDDDVAGLLKFCKFVYIDLLRTKTVDIEIFAPPLINFVKSPGQTFKEKDLRAAENAQRETKQLVNQFVQQIKLGNTPALELAKGAVSHCVSNIMHNTEAMMFLTKLNQKSNNAAEHAFNVCVLSIVLGRLLGFEPKELEIIGTCGLLHDLGEMKIPEDIRNKPSILSMEEMDIVKKHTEVGQEILLSSNNLFSGVIESALGHHENIDGTGYPRHLEGHQLSHYCKMVSVVDKYDAIITPKPYRPAADHLTAISIINKLAKSNKIEQRVSNALVGYLGIYPPGSIVRLSNNELAIVLEANLKQRLRPQILVVRDAGGEHTSNFVDLAETATDAKGRPLRIVSIHKLGEFGIQISDYFDLLLYAFN